MILRVGFWFCFLSLVSTVVLASNNCLEHANARWCFTFHAENATFENARSRCREANSYIASVPDYVTHNFVHKYLNENYNLTENVLIGLHFSFGVLRWDSGYPAVVDTFWKEPPESLNGKCVVMSPDGFWNPVDCTESHPFLCSSVERFSDAKFQTDFTIQECPTGFHLLGHRCLLFFTEEKSDWTGANSMCRDVGAELLTIQSFREQDLLVSVLADDTNRYWIGLFRNGSAYQWSNPAQPAVLFTNWMAGEPDRLKTSNCTLMLTVPTNLGQWSEAPCSTKAHFICETMPTRVKAHPDSHLHDILFVQGRCASGFYEYQSACYTLMHHPESPSRISELKPDRVSTTCSETVLTRNCTDGTLGTVLCPIPMSPRDHKHASFQRSLIDKFGGSAESAWVGLKGNRFLVYTDAPGLLESAAFVDHNSLKNETSCFALNKNELLLTSESCSAHLPAICGYFLDTHIFTPWSPPYLKSNTPVCKDGWVLYDSFCYRLEHTTPLSWDDAERACVQNYGHLVSINSEAEDSFIRSLIPSNLSGKPWIGLIVIHHYDTSTTHWSDGTVVSFSKYFADQFYPIEKECIRLDVVHGENVWTVDNCLTPAPYICKAVATSTDTDWDIKGTTHCLPGSHPEYCFSLNKTATSFRDVFTACRGNGQSVATILDDTQQDFITQAMRSLLAPDLVKNIPTRYWIGLVRTSESLDWVSGYPAVPNAYWKTGAEESTGTCAYLDIGIDSMLNWGLGTCDEKYPVICSTVPSLPQLPATIPQYKQYCPLGFLHVRGKCYKVEGDERNRYTFFQAAYKCSNLSGHLATVSSMQEQDIITVLIAQGHVPFWIGLITSPTGHYADWINNEPITYTYWKKGFPYSTSGESSLCAYVEIEPSEIGKWAGTGCDAKMGFICETEPSDTPSTQVTTPHLFSQEDCLPGFFHHRGACYKVLETQSTRSSTKLYDSLSAVCAASVNSSLSCETTRGLAGCPVVMTPHSHSEAAFMRLLISGTHTTPSGVEAWTGMKILSKDGQLIIQSEDGVDLKNLDMEFSRIESAAERIDESSFFSCLSFHTNESRLTIQPCSQPAYAVCGYYLNTHSLHRQVVDSNNYECPPDTQRVGRNCILYTSKRYSWLAAERFCNQLSDVINRRPSISGHLLSIHSNETLKYITTLREPVWIGLSSKLEHGYRAKLEWTDGSPTDYVAFGPSENIGSFIDSHLCTAVDPQTGFFKGEPCDSKLLFACQYPLESFLKRQSAILAGEYLPAVETCPVEFSLETTNACYAIVESPLSQKDAQTSCRTLDSNANLAAFHSSQEEENFLNAMSSKYGKIAYWMGLMQSDLEYKWVDSSIVDYMPKFGVSVELSHKWHIQDCFTLNVTSSANNPTTPLNATWHGSDCATKRPYICQLYRGEHGPNSMRPAPLARADLPIIYCPEGYLQHEDRCFKFFPTLASFDKAEETCKNAVGDPTFIGSLARISNSREQDFVSGLFAAQAPNQPSTAWIGLRQGKDKQFWNDGIEITYARRDLEFPAPVAHNLELEEEDDRLCTVMLYSSNVHFNGLWSRSICSVNDQNYFICQATPVQAYTQASNEKIVNDLSVLADKPYCPLGSTLGFYNYSAKALGVKLRLPNCLQLVSIKPMNWEDAHELCSKQSATLPSVDTLADLSFLRAWMVMPESIGGAGLPSNSSIWLDLKVDKCPQCYSNWTWHTGNELHESPVKIIDWFNAPSDPSGCYLFTATPNFDSSSSPDNTTAHLRSIRPAISCTALKLPVVCQVAADYQKNTQSSFLNVAEMKRDEGRCLKNPTPDLSNLEEFITNTSVARSGRKCIRWDLVRHNFTGSDAVLPQNWRIFSIEIAYDIHESPFWSDKCAHLAMQGTGNPGKTKYRYACYTSTDPVHGLEDCEMESCGNALMPLGWVIFLTLACLALSVLITVCIVRVKNRNRFYTPQNNARWLSTLKVTSSSNVFGNSVAMEQPQQRQHSVLYKGGGNDDPSVKVFGEIPSLVATNPSLLHSLVPSLTFKQSAYRPLHDKDPLLLDEEENADEFSGPV
nr:excretory/secretory C-type lectin TES-32 [Hymenolepis microstoma]